MQAKLEFELIMQRHDLKDEFDEELVLWSRAVVSYCKRACTKSAAIQALVGDVDIDCKLCHVVSWCFLVRVHQYCHICSI